MHLPKQYDSAKALEQYLGDPSNTNNVFSFKSAVELDEREEYPEEACQLLEQWNFHHYYIPAAYGGKLTSYEEMLALMRVVARRDLTAAIGHGKTYLGSVCVWVGGHEEQKHALAALLKNRVQVALGLTEKAHGSDLLTNEMRVTPVQDGYQLSGEKWLINNATRGRALTVFTQTDAKRGARGFSLFLVDKALLEPSSYVHLPKVKTHGIRGADISGIRFHECYIPHHALIGSLGSGLEIVLAGLQITRMMCASLSLGAADTALRTTLHFARARQLYGDTVVAIPYARSMLVDAFIDLLICDCAATAAARALHAATEQMSLWSAVIKHFVPTTIEKVMHNLSVVLGARYYLREGHWEGIFQKMVRDNALVSLFDGSTVVNVHAIALQLRQLATYRAKRASHVSKELLSCLEGIFSLEKPLPDLDLRNLTLSNRGRDDVVQGIETSLARLDILCKDVNTALLKDITDLTTMMLEVLNLQENILKDIPTTKIYHEPPELFSLAKQYCVLHAAAACLHMWLYNRKHLGNFFAQGEWLVLCLHKLMMTFQPSLKPPSSADRDNIAQELQRLYDEDRLFSIVPFELARTTQKTV
jgi:alkylation response protein AidB-like acyl-CoA dehydrogenase